MGVSKKSKNEALSITKNNNNNKVLSTKKNNNNKALSATKNNKHKSSEEHSALKIWALDIIVIVGFIQVIIIGEKSTFWSFFLGFILLLLVFTMMGPMSDKRYKKIMWCGWGIVAVVVAVTGISKLGKYKDYNLFVSQRNKFEKEYMKTVQSNLEQEDYVITATVKSEFGVTDNKRFNINGPGVYCYQDVFCVTAYVDDSFEKLSVREIINYANTQKKKLEKMVNSCCETAAPFYSENIKKGTIPGKEFRVVQYLSVKYEIVCKGIKYSSFADDEFYKGGKRVGIYQKESAPYPVKKGSKTDSKPTYYGGFGSSSKTKKHFDPDDYDSPEDFADDAWGVDFDDWDEAYEYWENW